MGPSVRLHDGLDLGGGFGLARVSGDGFASFNRWSITPFRLVLRPLLIAVPEHQRHEWMGVLSVFWKETYFYGRVTGADFNVETPYVVDGELTRSFGVNFDLGAVANALGLR
jgi:hypothetical protein